MGIDFRSSHEPAYGQVVTLSPMVRRVTAQNPGKFTGWGTGTYIVGRGAVAVVDPGPDDPAHVRAVLDAVAGEEVTHLLVTHTHRDHSPASRAVQAATAAPTYGFGPHPTADLEARRAADSTDGADAAEEEPGDGAFAPDVELGDGDVVSTKGWTIEVLHTPGHISNHLCFALADERALFSGDHVMGWSTTVIPPPDGNMADYLANLERLLPRNDERYYPTHGPHIDQPQAYVAQLLAHRREREAQILVALAARASTVEELVATLYTDVAPELHKAAGRSVLAHLTHLHAQGRVTPAPDTDPTVWVA